MKANVINMQLTDNRSDRVRKQRTLIKENMNVIEQCNAEENVFRVE